MHAPEQIEGVNFEERVRRKNYQWISKQAAVTFPSISNNLACGMSVAN
jgi:hypothetical protein